MPKKKLLLVNPVDRSRYGFYKTRADRHPPLNLALIAALTPDHWDIKIADENLGEMEFVDADLVGLTSLTAAAPRAYAIAGVYRQRRIPTVIGGIHATLLPDEAGQYVDTVVVGEADDLWPKVIADFEAGRLQRRYVGNRPTLANLPNPRRDLLDPAYTTATVQTSRGCPMKCDFCAVNAVYGGRHRQRPVAEVLDEIAAIRQNLIFFVDDNILGYGAASKARARQLFQGMIDRKLNKTWFACASLNFADDEALLSLARQSGCRMVFLGVESEDPDGLTEMNKNVNFNLGVQNYEEHFRRINRHQIAVMGNFIIGLDSDTPEKLRSKADYMRHCGLNVMDAFFLTPFPGTKLFHKVQRENRLIYTNFPADWKHYDLLEIVIVPKNISPEELLKGMQHIVREIFSLPRIFYQFGLAWLRTRSFSASVFSIIPALSMRKMNYNRHIKYSSPTKP